MNSPAIFFKKTYEETQILLHTSRHYMRWQAPLDIKALTQEERSRVMQETTRIAIRLSQISAWLMVQKALETQELSLKEALSREYHVFRHIASLEQVSETDAGLPQPLRELLKESRLLYLRILRLDQTFREAHSPT